MIILLGDDVISMCEDDVNHSVWQSSDHSV